MKWFALIVLGIAIAAALVSGLPFASGRADGEEAVRFIDVELAPPGAMSAPHCAA